MKENHKIYWKHFHLKLPNDEKNDIAIELVTQVKTNQS